MGIMEDTWAGFLAVATAKDVKAGHRVREMTAAWRDESVKQAGKCGKSQGVEGFVCLGKVCERTGSWIRRVGLCGRQV